MNMKVQLLVMLWVWVIATPDLTQAKVTFDLLKGADAYAQSVSQLRDLLKAKDKKKKDITCHGLPVLARDDTSTTTKYTLVELKGDKSKTISLAIDLKTIYVSGYSDRLLSDGKCRTFVFKDLKDDEKERVESTVCNGEKVTKENKITLRYTGSYPSLGGVAGKRENVEVGIEILKERLDNIYGKVYPKKEMDVKGREESYTDKDTEMDKKTQARFLLAAIQMISEAVRFEYIVDQVKSKAEFTPNWRMITLENEWGKISRAIESAGKDGEFGKRAPKDLENEDGTERIVTNVRDIKGDIALLNHVTDCKVKGTKSFTFYDLLKPYYMDNYMGVLEGF